MIAIRETSRLWSVAAFTAGSKAVTLSTQPVSTPGGSTGLMPRMKPTRHGKGRTRTGLSDIWLVGIAINYKISAG